MEERQKMELLPAGWRKFDIMDVTCLMLKLVLKQFFTLLEVDPKMASFSERCWSNELMMCESTACAWWGMAPGLQFSRIALATKADRIGSPWLQIQGTITWDKWSHPFDVLHEIIFLDWQDLFFIPDIIEFNPLFVIFIQWHMKGVSVSRRWLQLDQSDLREASRRPGWGILYIWNKHPSFCN